MRSDYRELEAGLLEVYGRAVAHCVPGASLADLDRLVRAGIADIGFPGQPTHPICHGIGARAHEPPYAHQAAGGEIAEGMVLAIEPGCYWEGGGGLRVEDNFPWRRRGRSEAEPASRMGSSMSEADATPPTGDSSHPTVEEPTAKEELGHGDLKPILPGPGGSDYERYLRTDDLLELQKKPEEMTHRDELLFQTVHQLAPELWLKLACFEIEEAIRS